MKANWKTIVFRCRYCEQIEKLAFSNDDCAITLANERAEGICEHCFDAYVIDGVPGLSKLQTMRFGRATEEKADSR